jgi:very-short-patch-repair endonuclease
MSAGEKTYFFKGLIDCVVIDAEDNFKPKRFFELDSVYHDSEIQIGKDKMKDNILAISGHKLYRIRRTSVKNNEQDFTRLIREIIK